MASESILSILAHGAWNGGTLIDNSLYENRSMTFKNDIPVNGRTIEERIGVRTRMAAPANVHIGLLATQNLLDKTDMDPSRIKLLITATNVGEDKYDPGPMVRFPLQLIQKYSPNVVAIDLYAGSSGYNVAVELLFMLSINGILAKDNLAVIVGAENIYRAGMFRPSDTASIVFGDDAMATAFIGHESTPPVGRYSVSETTTGSLGPDPYDTLARNILEITGDGKIDGLIVDNQLGKIEYRMPATAARIQKRLVELAHPRVAADGLFDHFKEALAFYDDHVGSFAFDIASMKKDPRIVNAISRAYVRSGKYNTVVSIYIRADQRFAMKVHRGDGFTFTPPKSGVIDTVTRTHSCFCDYIQAINTSDGDVFGEMNGKGVFLYATCGAGTHLKKLLGPHHLNLDAIDLLIAHQANFAMLPLTLEQLLKSDHKDVKGDVAAFISRKSIVNVHTRGSCSVACMQRLPYDLQRGALRPDTIQGIPINRNLEKLKRAKIIVNDSVGAGMTRSSFLQKKP